MPPTTIELHIRRLPDASLVAELRAELPRSRVELGSAPIDLNPEALRARSASPEVYGATLSAMVFPAPLREAWERARGYAERGGEGIHARVAIDVRAPLVGALRWELLRDPTTNTPLAQQEGGSLARLVVVEQLHDATPPPRPALRALVAVAGPADAAHYGLAPVDVAAEARRAAEALGDIPADLLADTTLATLANLRNGLRDGPHLLYLVCHGRATPQGTTLYLVGDDGNAAPISGDQLAAEVAALDAAHRPLLAVLVVCEGADQETAPLASVGPLLARAGVPAVIAMQATISMDAAAQLTARLLRELGRDGRIDRALAAARKELGDAWWVPVLWLRSRDGRLWSGEAAEPEQISARVADNPANLFSLSIERLQRNERQWDTVLLPILGLLLAARAPLSQRALRALIGADDLRTKQGLQRLGELIQRDGEGRYGLLHLNLGDFLRQDVFASDEEQRYHQQLAIWCETGELAIIWQDASGDALEQERRGYARQHYVAHLAAARSYDQLGSVIDSGAYGAAKRRHDPSTRSYALDLDIARQAVVDATAGDADAQARALPRLWRYSLLRCSLTSQADNYPEELFVALVALGQSEEVIRLAERLRDPVKKTNGLRMMATSLISAQRWDAARAAADAIADRKERVKTLGTLAGSLAVANHPAASSTLDAARAAADAIADREERAKTLGALAAILANTQHPSALAIFADARAIADAIPDQRRRAFALSDLATSLASAQRWNDARVTTDAIVGDPQVRITARRNLAAALIEAQRGEEAITVIDAISDDDGCDNYYGDYADYGVARTAAFSNLAALFATKHLWVLAHRAALHIHDEESRAKVLLTLATNLTHAQHPFALKVLEDARAAANRIPQQGRRDDVLHTHAHVLAAAQRGDESRAAITAISVPKDRANAPRTLATALSQTGQLTLLTDLWRRAQTRDELLRLFVVPPELLRAYPELGQAFLDSFAWVDDQLKAG